MLEKILRLLTVLSRQEIAYSHAPVQELRSPDWRDVAQSHLSQFPYCAVCGHKKDLNVHHIKPFSLYPELELDPDNLLTLGVKCPTGNHHLLFGHFGNWKLYNPDVVVVSSMFYQHMKGKR